MKSVAFYSYKGGAGRTLAATNFAIYLARLKLRTVILDMDLEAPGVDSKFVDFSLPEGQHGILDYILDFQRTGNAPGSVKHLLVDVPIATPYGNFSVGLIPAGYYMAPNYSSKLNELDWSRIFSHERSGTAFFKQLLARIESELKPDFLIIDSRTGIGEVAGVCTQQLADEVVILTSLAGESLKMTKYLVHAISNSPIADALGKKIDVKVVLARIPKAPDPTQLKSHYGKLLGIQDKQLFFLFSSPVLEQSEFLALLGTHKDEDLISNYIRLFHGLDIGLADESIKEQIANTEATLLSVTPEESEARILELTALYPHPEVYRTAMRYYRLSRKSEGVYLQARRLLEVKPDDEEAQRLLVETFLGERTPVGAYGFVHRHGQRKTEEIAQVADVGWEVFKRDGLPPQQVLSLASVLDGLGDLARSHSLAMSALESNVPQEWRTYAYTLAAKTAIRSGKHDVANKLITNIPPSELRGPVAEFAIKTLFDAGDGQAAFELALTIIQQDITFSMLEQAAHLADKLGKRQELIAAITSSKNLDYLMGSHDLQDKLTKIGLEDVIQLLPDLRVRRRRPTFR